MTFEKQFEGIPGILQNLGVAALLTLRKASTTVYLGKRESLPALTNPPDSFIFVNTGWLSLALDDTTVAMLKPGEAFMGPVLPYDSRSFSRVTLTAATDATVLIIKRAPLLTILHDRPDLLFALYEQACERLTRVYMRLARQNEDSLEVRLSSLLWSLGIPDELGDRYVPPITQDILAACLSTAREEVSRKRQLLVKSGKLFKKNDKWYLSKEVGLLLAVKSYGE